MSPSFEIKLKEHKFHINRKEKEIHMKNILQENQEKWNKLLNDPVIIY